MLSSAQKASLIGLVIATVLCSQAASSDARSDRTLRAATGVLRDAIASNRIPQDVINRSRCIVILPRVGDAHLRGVATCRTGYGWSAPAFVTLSGGKLGTQFSAQSSDAILFILSDRAADLLLKLDQRRAINVGAPAEGSEAISNSDVQSYTRTPGAFSGVDVSGTNVALDRDLTKDFYGRAVDSRSLLTGYVPAPPGPASEFLEALRALQKPTPKQEANYQTVKLFYVTDRRQKNDASPFQYSSDRSSDAAMHFGTALVSIPLTHKKGELETASLFRLEFRNDPEKHVTLLNVIQQAQSDFLRDVRERVKSDPSKEILIFIHGYNVTFEDAARRLGQITRDLAFPGAPILYSWPSQGTYWGYEADEATVEWSIPHFKTFLENIAQQSGASVVHVIAHSMGNRLLVGALNSLAIEHKTLRPTLQQVVLAAPDIDSGVFRQLADAVSKTGSHFTIYESSSDEALKASHKLHDYTRLGDSQPNVQIVSPYDTVDATRVDTGLLGHSYFAENKSILSDIFYLIQGKPPAERFGLQRKSFGSQVYWMVEP